MRKLNLEMLNTVSGGGYGGGSVNNQAQNGSVAVTGNGNTVNYSGSTGNAYSSSKKS